jgi:CspA family cold shock protein
MSNDKLQRGRVKKWFEEAGYGFIRLSVTADEIFVHYSDLTAPQLKPRLQAGEEVEFAIEQTNRGPKAVNVVIVSDREQTPTPYKEKWEGAGFPRTTRSRTENYR